MHPTLFHLYGIQITTYGLMIAAAFATLWFCAVRHGGRLGYSADFIQNLLTIIVVSAMVFARLLYVLTDLDYFLAHPSEIIFRRDAYVFLGGFIGAVSVSAWYTKKNGLTITGVGDLFAPYVALAQGIGRIGCFLFGCCYGGLCTYAWGVRFPVDSPAYVDHVNNGWIRLDELFSLPVHPTQIYHSLFNFLHFFILLWIRKRQTFRGQLAVSYLIIYSIGRFIVEFFRGDYRGSIGFLSTSQMISILLFSLGTTLFFVLRKKGYPPERSVAVENRESE